MNDHHMRELARQRTERYRDEAIRHDLARSGRGGRGADGGPDVDAEAASLPARPRTGWGVLMRWFDLMRRRPHIR